MAVQLLFTPGHLGRLPVKNRLFMAPMVRNYADEQGCMTPRYLAHLERIARGGVGAMILEASFVSAEGRGFRHQLGIHDDRVIPGLREMVHNVHAHDTLIGMQLFHAGRQTTHQVCHDQPVAPSEIPCPLLNELPHALDLTEIHALVRAFGDAAGRAKRAGIDFIEIHAAHGYLINQFLSPFSNRRTDIYGGSVENRRRFLGEIIEAIREAAGTDYPITTRISADEMVPGGMGATDAVELARWLEQQGIVGIHVSACNYASYGRGRMIPPMATEDAPLVKYAAIIKQAIDIPVIAVAKLRTPALAEAVLENGQADFVALGRELLADPDWPIKAQLGQTAEIHRCVACNQGCISRLFAQRDVWCTVNPECGREREFSEIRRTGNNRKVIVAGAGAAGMAAARYTAMAGFRVILCEATSRCGGQLHAAAAAPYRSDWKYLLQQLQHDISSLAEVEMRFNTRVTRKLINQEQPYAVIVATGAVSIRPKIPGIENINVVIARDLLEGHSKAYGSVLIAGGGCAGAQTAEYLATKGHTVTIAEMEGEIAADAPLDDRTLLLGRLNALGVKIMPHTRLLSIEDDMVNLQSGGEIFDLAVDTVVLCLGARAIDRLEHELIGLVPHLFTTGDAVRPRKVTEAILDGALAGLGLTHDVVHDTPESVTT
jgi:2,4-dienoyl-CoA reductase-like NADH-dependent reductase (Old Yellow Enzyme family)/thioredoxin reductase